MKEIEKAFNDNDVECSKERLIEIYSFMDHDSNGEISYSEWFCALAFIKQLTIKNLSKVFQFLDLQSEGLIDLMQLEHAYRPHLFRLKLGLNTDLL